MSAEFKETVAVFLQDPRRWKSFQSRTEPTVLQPKRALILTKLSRYEFERLRHADLNEKQLQEALRKRGSDYNHLLYHHTIHKNCEAAVIKALKEHNIETKVVQCSLHSPSRCHKNHL